jgi:hypothetical protein
MTALPRCRPVLVREAAEAAAGARHVTVVLGEVNDAVDLDRYWVLARAIRFLVDGHRRRVRWHGDAVSVTVWGHRADEVVMEITDVAQAVGVVEVRETLW